MSLPSAGTEQSAQPDAGLFNAGSPSTLDDDAVPTPKQCRGNNTCPHMKQSSDLVFRQFNASDFETYAGAEAFCPNTVGAAPMICETEDGECVYIIDRCGYTAFVPGVEDSIPEEWFTPFTEESDVVAYWPTSPLQAENLGWSKR